MGRSTVHYADNETNNILKKLHNKLRPAGTPVERVEYIIELLLLRIFEVKLKQDDVFKPLRQLFERENYRLLFSHLLSLTGEQILSELNKNIFPFYATILSKARPVINGNLPQKMRDQLVLMEEVFANSNFTNNVKGGVIAEVIGLVNEIDEKYILKTDLLGDAIESALSETGGTQDLGLHRTPGHIRRMMVEMLDPDFTDTIDDPTCGTAGFLFDAYDYVIEKARRTRKIPAEHIANMFYRSGISGIEYQGRIRKMAAVNMYIRGLNPQNIQQGDSLKMFDPSYHGKSKSVVIANPPFGAERDQPAYPNVWEEYSREAETTILFVKLMFELLNEKGRCAVIVSEGFLTWGQGSACALRKILLNEANLRAIISLPQGIFVSKSGQGAKTSILYFEKGSPTDFVWYYKIENDGFSMGTNRKEIEGSQIPELLKTFKKEVKQGRRPEDTQYSFCISKEQIETLDPRIAARIHQEVKTKTTEKTKVKREKLVDQLDKKLADNKISRDMYDEKLWQFDNIVESQIDNEIAKAIEKAHSYHFNLQNYRSNLRPEQIKDWQNTLDGVEMKNGSAIEKRYQQLQKTEPKIALQILASFEPQDSLQMDIAREYLSKLGEEILGQDERLGKLEEILRKGFRYPVVPLKKLIIVNNDKIKPSEFPDTEFTVLGVSNQTGVFINEKLKGREIKQSYFRVYKNQFCYNPYRINVGSIGFGDFDIENQIISGAYNVFGCKENAINPKYLEALFKTKRFSDYVNEKAHGGVRMNFKIEYMQDWQIPLPPLEIQKELVEKIERQKQVIEGAEKIEANINFEVGSFNEVPMSSIFDFEYGVTKSASGSGDFRLIRITDINNLGQLNSQAVFTDITDSETRYVLRCGDLVMARTGATFGKVLYFDSETPSVFASYLIRFIPKISINKKYVYYFCLSQRYWTQANMFVDGGTQPQFSSSKISQIKIPLPSLEMQALIVEKLDRQMQALNGVRLLKSETEKRIEEILAEVWAEE